MDFRGQTDGILQVGFDGRRRYTLKRIDECVRELCSEIGWYRVYFAPSLICSGRVLFIWRLFMKYILDFRWRRIGKK